MANPQQRIFLSGWDKKGLRFFVDQGVPDHEDVRRNITLGGGVLLNAPDRADIILVAEDTGAAQQYLAQAPDGKATILKSRWVQECLRHAKLLDSESGWKDCLVAVEGVGLPRIEVDGGGVSQPSASSPNAPFHYYHDPSRPSDAPRPSSFASTSRSGPAEQSNVHQNIPSSNLPHQYAMPFQSPQIQNTNAPYLGPQGYHSGGIPVSSSSLQPSQLFLPQQPNSHDIYGSPLPSMATRTSGPGVTVRIPPSLNGPVQSAMSLFADGLSRLTSGALLLLDAATAGATGRLENSHHDVGPSTISFYPSNFPSNSMSAISQNMQYRPNPPQATYPSNAPPHDVSPRISEANVSSSNPARHIETGRRRIRISNSRQAADDDLDGDTDPEEELRGRHSTYGPIRHTRGEKAVPPRPRRQIVLALDDSLAVPDAVPTDSGAGNSFTVEDQIFFCKQLKYVLETKGEVAKQAFFQAIAEKAQHHTEASWRRWYSKNEERQQTVKDIAGMEERNRLFARKKTRVHGGGKGKERAANT